jgi:transposase InsO family protein
MILSTRRNHSAKMLLNRHRFTHVEMLPKGCVLKLTMKTRREVIHAMSARYRKAKSRNEKSAILDEAVALLKCHRKHAIRTLTSPPAVSPAKSKRKRPLAYQEAMPVIQRVWEALDYPCAERLHPVLLETALTLASHGHLRLNDTVQTELQAISRPTLARRLSTLRCPKARPSVSNRKPLAALRAQVPMITYDWDETRPGALEIDLVEHNGGSSLGHYAYTLTVTDVVSGYTRRRALLGKSQLAVLRELKLIVSEWPMKPWAIHSDNGQEFLNAHLKSYCSTAGIQFTRSRPYRKNDNAHVEQKNGFLVRQLVGYERYDRPEQVEWLNAIYSLHDRYFNFCLPTRKLVGKERHGARVKKTFDTAKAPAVRLIETDTLSPEQAQQLQSLRGSQDPLTLHKQLEALLTQPATSASPTQQEEAV